MNVHTADIELYGAGEGTIRVGGHDLSNAVRSLTLDAGVGDVPTLRLELMTYELTNASGEVEVRLADATHEALIALGWTPPKDDT